MKGVQLPTPQVAHAVRRPAVPVRSGVVAALADALAAALGLAPAADAQAPVRAVSARVAVNRDVAQNRRAIAAAVEAPATAPFPRAIANARVGRAPGDRGRAHTRRAPGRRGARPGPVLRQPLERVRLRGHVRTRQVL